MTIKLDEIVTFLKHEACIKVDVAQANCKEINGYTNLDNPKEYAITWIKDARKVRGPAIMGLKNMALISNMPLEHVNESCSVLVCEYPKAAFFSIIKKFFYLRKSHTIASTAIVESKKIGSNVGIGHFSYIGPDVEIADNVEISNHVSIECPCKIGANTRIGSGTIIGNDGFGFYKDAQGIYQRVPHTGGVIIGQDVEIDANVCIDRGTIGDTIIEDFVKIDNFCQIAHNVRICRNTIITGHVALAGSCCVHENGYIAPGSLVMNQKTIGRDSLVGMGSVVVRNVPAGKVVSGNPAQVLWDNV